MPLWYFWIHQATMRWEIDRSFPAHTVFLQIYLWMLFSLVSMHGKGKQLIIIIESVQKKYIALRTLAYMYVVMCSVFCVFFLRCNEQVAWMKCSLSSGVMQLYFFLPLLIRVINRVDSGIIERKGKNEIHGNIWMQIAAFNPFLLKAIISLATDILDVKRLLFSQHELSICLSISLASSKKQLVIQ